MDWVLPVFFWLFARYHSHQIFTGAVKVNECVVIRYCCFWCEINNAVRRMRCWRWCHTKWQRCWRPVKYDCLSLTLLRVCSVVLRMPSSLRLIIFYNGPRSWVVLAPCCIDLLLIIQLWSLLSIRSVICSWTRQLCWTSADILCSAVLLQIYAQYSKILLIFRTGNWLMDNSAMGNIYIIFIMHESCYCFSTS